MLNGEEKKLSKDMTVQDMLRMFKIREERVAVQINLDVIDRNKFPETTVKDGDKIEVVNFVGGG